MRVKIRTKIRRGELEQNDMKLAQLDINTVIKSILIRIFSLQCLKFEIQKTGNDKYFLL